MDLGAGDETGWVGLGHVGQPRETVRLVCERGHLAQREYRDPPIRRAVAHVGTENLVSLRVAGGGALGVDHTDLRLDRCTRLHLLPVQREPLVVPVTVRWNEAHAVRDVARRVPPGVIGEGGSGRGGVEEVDQTRTVDQVVPVAIRVCLQLPPAPLHGQPVLDPVLVRAESVGLEQVWHVPPVGATFHGRRGSRAFGGEGPEGGGRRGVFGGEGVEDRHHGERAHPLPRAHFPRGVAVFVGGTLHPWVEADPTQQRLLAVELRRAVRAGAAAREQNV